jgi:hypothetical protein
VKKLKKSRFFSSKKSEKITNKHKKKTFDFKFLNFRIKFQRRILNLALIILSCFFILTISINKANFAPNRVLSWLRYSFLSFESGGSFPISISGHRVKNSNFLLLGKDAVLLSDSSVMVFGHNAKNLYNNHHRLSNPILATGGWNILSYDLFGKSFEIDNKIGMIKSGELEENAMCAAICDAGTYGFVTEAKGYLSKMLIYSPDGNQIYEYDFADCLVGHLCINKNGNLAAAVGVCSQNGRMRSCIYLFDFKSEKPKCFFEYEDIAFFDIKFLSNGGVIAVGDKLTCALKIGGEKTDYGYENKILKRFDMSDKGVTLALASGANQTDDEVHVLNSYAKLYKNFAVNLGAESMAYNGEVIAVLSDEKVVTYSKNGKQQKQFDVGKDVKNIKISGRQLYMLCLNEIRVLEI